MPYTIMDDSVLDKPSNFTLRLPLKNFPLNPDGSQAAVTMECDTTRLRFGLTVLRSFGEDPSEMQELIISHALDEANYTVAEVSKKPKKKLAFQTYLTEKVTPFRSFSTAFEGVVTDDPDEKETDSDTFDRFTITLTAPSYTNMFEAFRILTQDKYVAQVFAAAASPDDDEDFYDDEDEVAEIHSVELDAERTAGRADREQKAASMTAQERAEVIARKRAVKRSNVLPFRRNR